MSALAPGRFATTEQLKEASGIFDAVGGVLTVAESQMDAVTALSGSGPAYFFLVVEALVDAGVAAGLTRPVATDLVAQTMAGSAAMLLERLDTVQSASDSAMGTGMDTTAAATAGHGHLSGRHNRRWSARTRKGRRSGRDGRGRRGRKARSSQLGITSR